MKKNLFIAIALLPLWGLGGFSLYAQSSVNVTLLNAAPGAPASLTFSVEWEAGSRDAIHRDSVWIFADFQPIDANGNTGAWKAATFTALPAVIDGAGTPVVESFSGRGFYLAGNPSGAFASTLTATLTEPVNTKFNACVYASDYPPNATLNPGGGYTLHGSPPFIINNSIRETTRTFAAGTCITSITDSTGCPGFVDNGAAFATGAIAATGESICVGGTPSLISSIMPVSGGDQSVIYSWYKDGVPISGATDANYTPPPADAATAGVHTYTRQVRDNTCNITPALSTGSWVLTVGAIPTLTSANNPAICYGQTTNLSVTGGAGTYSWTVGGAAAQTTSTNTHTTAALTATTTYSVTLTDANGCTSAAASGNITVNALPTIAWSSGGNASQTVTVGSAISAIVFATAGATGVTPSGLPTGISGAWSSPDYTVNGTPSTTGTYNYTLTTTNANGCDNASVNGTITVTVKYQNQGSCTFTQPAVVGTFAAFPSSYSASTFVTLTDERDGNNYTVVKLGNKWVMAQNLNYQMGLTWQANSNMPSTGSGQNTALIGHFWCPGGYSSGATTSTQASCDVWGALYSWETAMSFDGLGGWSENTTYHTGAANATSSQFNHGRTATGSGTGGRGICPPNWHVPTDFEWGVLLDAMEGGGGNTHQTASNTGWMGTNAGSRAKAACTVGDNSTSGNTYVNDTQANWYYRSGRVGIDYYRFRVLPAGYLTDNGSSFGGRGTYAYFWCSSAYSSTNAWLRGFRYENANVYRDYNTRSFGFSVRCIQN